MLGPVENTIYVNQQTAAVSADKGNAQNRLDLQNTIAAEAAAKEEKEVKEVRPTEENHAIDPDREHQKHEAQDEEDAKEKQHPSEDETTQDESSYKGKEPFHLLDIKV